MKPKVLLIYMDTSAKEGIIPYLSSIFHSYLEFDSQLIHQLDLNSIDQYQLILFSSQLCKRVVYDTVSNLGIPTYLCQRALNLSYIHRLLEIPAFSKVYIINDRQKNCEAIRTALINLGFTSFQYEIFYPDAPSVDPTIQYGITPGESRYAPSTVKNVIDIGNRVVDISTLCWIVLHFNLPETLLTDVSNIYVNYIGNFVRFSNRQLENVTEKSLNSSRILNSLSFGLCVTSGTGQIFRYNKAFLNFLGIPEANITKKSLPELLKSMDVHTSLEELISVPSIFLENAQGKQFHLSFSNHFLSVTQTPGYIFIASDSADSSSAPSVKRMTQAHFRDSTQPDIFRLLLQSTRISHIIEQARHYAGSSSCILILGPNGLYQQSLANMIHTFSPQAQNVYAYLDARNPEYIQTSDDISHSPVTTRFEDFLSRASGGTLFIENIDHASRSFQSFLCQYLKSQENHLFFPVNHSKDKLRLVCSASSLDRLMDPEIFDSELFYRINSLPITLPSMKELRDTLPAFYQFYFNELLNHAGVQLDDIFSAKLLNFLMLDYDYPGNFAELESICSYFSSNYAGKKLTLANLPPYIRTNVITNTPNLSAAEVDVLAIIKNYPRSGRNRIAALLEEQGKSISPNQIRAILSNLGEKHYIQILKTKQGCTITELGDYILSQTPSGADL